MGLNANFNMNDIGKLVDGELERVEASLIYGLNTLGLECVQIARTLNTYKDRTANLRNSIGYLILKDGEILETHFEEEPGRGADWTAASGQGEKVGLSFAKTVAPEFKSFSFALLVVAGMNYASYVEDIHHLDVLSPAKIYAETEWIEIAKDVMENFKK